MSTQFNDDQSKEKLSAFKEFLSKLKKEHPNELRELNSSDLALFDFQNNIPTLRIHAKINAGLRKIIHAKWTELFPRVE